MRTRKNKVISFILVIMLIVSGLIINGNSSSYNGKLADSGINELKEYTVSNEELDEITKLSLKDGKKAA